MCDVLAYNENLSSSILDEDLEETPRFIVKMMKVSTKFKIIVNLFSLPLSRALIRIKTLITVTTLAPQ